MKTAIINLLFFKAGWAASVLGAAASIPTAAIAAAAGVVSFHLWCSENVRGEVLLLMCAASIGLIWESALIWIGLINYDTGFFAPGLAPYWIVAMWLLFATTLNVSMRWLRRSVLVASFAGAIGGPLAFLAGERMGAVSFDNPAISLAVIGIGWAVLLPLLVNFAVRFDGQPLEAKTADQPSRGFAQ